jgi:transposase
MKRHPYSERSRRGIVIARNAMKESGYSDREIGRIFGIPWITIYKWHRMFLDPAREKMFRREYSKTARRRRKSFPA